MLYDARILKGASMARFAKYFVLLSVLLLTFSIRHLQTTMAGNPPAEGKEVVLKATDITPKIFPERVFFRGQSAPVQFRNSGGVHFADDFYVLAGLVDSSGYSSAIKEKYQAYLLNEVTLEIAGQTFAARCGNEAPRAAASACRRHRCNLQALRGPRLRGIPQGPLAQASALRGRTAGRGKR